jgi:hypothetical protein
MYKINEDFYVVLDELPEYPFNSRSIPTELQNQILCINIPNIEQIAAHPKKSQVVLDIFCNKYPWLNNIQHDLRSFDTLSFSGAYFPTAHTDIEWNKIKNPGFQIWSLVKNNKYEGNMYILLLAMQRR